VTSDAVVGVAAVALANGSMQSAWCSADGSVFASYASSTQAGWAAPRRIESMIPYASQLALAAGPSGSPVGAAIAWTSDTNAYISTSMGDGVWKEPVTLDETFRLLNPGARFEGPLVAIGASGKTIVAGGGRRLFAQVSSNGDSWLAPTPPPAPEFTYVSELRLALSPSGVSMLAWVNSGSATASLRGRLSAVVARPLH
jgi:hypothetical protein